MCVRVSCTLRFTHPTAASASDKALSPRSVADLRLQRSKKNMTPRGSYANIAPDPVYRIELGAPSARMSAVLGCVFCVLCVVCVVCVSVCARRVFGPHNSRLR